MDAFFVRVSCLKMGRSGGAGNVLRLVGCGPLCSSPALPKDHRDDVACGASVVTFVFESFLASVCPS